jgi:formate/nitrite transporter FocA (FNT family)
VKVEGDINKFLILALYAGILADLLTHGTVAVQLGNIVGGIVTNAFRLSAGQTVK